MVIRWPVRLPIIPGECLSSWLRRIGFYYGLTVKELVREELDFPELKANKLDMKAPDELISALSARTGIPQDRIKRTTLAGVLPFLFEDSQSDQVSCETCSVLWEPSSFYNGYVTNLVPWFRSRMKICRLCYSDFPNTGVMLSWGLNLVLSCPIHGLMLEPVKLKRKSVEWFKDKAEKAPEMLTSVDGRSSKALSEGVLQLPGGKIDAGLWFCLLQIIFQELNTIQPFGSRRFEWQEMVWETAGYCPSPSSPYRFNRSCALLIAIAMKQIEEQTFCPKGKYSYLFFTGSRKRTRTLAPAYEKSEVGTVVTSATEICDIDF
jgi:hypothetical protein